MGPLKEGDHVKIRCQTDGNPQPHFTINKQVQNEGSTLGARRVHKGAGKEVETVAGGLSAYLHPFILSQDSSTGEMEEETTDENGILSLEPAQKHHSGLYQCQSLDLETTITLSSDLQELLVNCEALGWRFRLGREELVAVPSLMLLLCPQMCLMFE